MSLLSRAHASGIVPSEVERQGTRLAYGLVMLPSPETLQAYEAWVMAAMLTGLRTREEAQEHIRWARSKLEGRL